MSSANHHINSSQANTRREKGLLAACADSLGAVVKLKDEWLALEQKSEAPLSWFQTYHYCHHWLTLHAALYDRPAVISLHEDGELIAVWPMMTTRSRLGVRLLSNLGEPHTQYGGVLTRFHRLADTQAEALLAAVRELRGIDSAILNFIPTHSPLARYLPAPTEMRELRNESALLNLSRFTTEDDYLNSRTREQRKNRGRKLRLLEKQGKVRFRVMFPENHGFRALTKQCLAFKRVWLAKTGRAGHSLRMGRHDQFLTGLASSQDQQGPVLFALELDGKAIAIEIGFLHKGHYYSYISSFNFAYYETSPGKVLMEKAIGWLIGQRATAYDLLANPTDYKNSWTDNQIPLSSHRIDYSFKGKLYSWGWATRGRPMVKKTFEALPLRLRTGLLMLRDMSSKPLD